MTIAVPSFIFACGGTLSPRMQVSMRSNRTQLEGNKMIRSTRGLRVMLGLCVLALGVFGASSAQAAKWQVAGAGVTGTETKPLTGVLATTGILHTKIGGNEVLFECKKGSLIGGNLEKEGLVSAGTTKAKVKFEECITKINTVENAACKPNNNGTEPGVIVSNDGQGKLVLHSTGEGVTLIESNVKETIGGVANTPVFGRVKMSVECPIGSNIPIIGNPASAATLAVKDVGGNAGLEEEKAAHEIEEFAALTEIWALTKTAEHVAKVLGKAKITVTAGSVWSGKPE